MADAPHVHYSTLPGYIDATQKVPRLTRHTPIAVAFSPPNLLTVYQPVRLPVWTPCTSSSHRCGHCFTLWHGTFVFQSTLVQPSPVLPCPALWCPCPRQSPPPMFPASIGLDTNSLTTARSTTATDCLTVAHPVPSLHACRTRGRPGSVWYLVSSYCSGFCRTQCGPAAALCLLPGRGYMAQVSIISSLVLASSRHCSATPC